jgi:tripartite-type tricarboxylate transporter receptor subunit TctC
MFTRRKALHIGAGVVAFPLISGVVRADAYPNRPVRIIVAFAAGGAADILARLIAQSLSAKFGQQFIVENRPGAGGTIGTEVVARAVPDGYTLLMEVATANAINATLYTNLNFDFIRDIAPVASVGEGTYVMVVSPSVPAKTLPEFIAYAKSNPGKINMASTGNGTPTHVFGELFNSMAGVEMVHVPYRGSFMPDLLSGQVQVLFGPLPQSIEHIKSGKLRALAVTSRSRSQVLPDIPTVAESVPGYEASGWYGMGAPKATPSEIIKTLNNEINIALAEEKMRERLVDNGVIPTPMTSGDFGKLLVSDVEKWGKVIRAANIKPD